MGGDFGRSNCFGTLARRLPARNRIIESRVDAQSAHVYRRCVFTHSLRRASVRDPALSSTFVQISHRGISSVSRQILRLINRIVSTRVCVSVSVQRASGTTETAAGAASREPQDAAALEDTGKETSYVCKVCINIYYTGGSRF